MQKVTDPALLQQLGNPEGAGIQNPAFPSQMANQAAQTRHTNAETARIPLQNENTAVSTAQNRQQLQFNGATTAAGLFDKFTADPAVKAYREVLPQVAQAMSSGPGGPNDISVVYAWAKAMDPTGSVRDQDVKLGQSAVGPLQQAKFMVSKYKLEDGGQLPPEVKVGLIEAMRNKGRQLDRQYSQVRANFIKQAEKANINTDIFGQHEGNLFQSTEEQYIKAHSGTPKVDGVPLDGAVASAPPGQKRELTPEGKAQFFDIMQKQGADAADEYLYSNFGLRMKDKSDANKPHSNELVKAQQGTFANSYAGQGLSGANEGLASVLGAPADLARAAINLVPQGINAVANTNIPTLPEPIGGGQWFKDRLSDIGSIQAPSDDGSKQFVRRVGQSVGAAAVPAGMAGSLGKAAAGILSGLGGGLGGATAQKVFPNNPVAEFLGELAGGGTTGFSLAKLAQGRAQRGIEAAVPSVANLKDQASQLYHRAETRGVAASPPQTKQLATDMRQILRDEGQLGPKGKITNADTNTSKALNLVEQYAGKTMKPKEMDTVRRVLGDSRKSPDASDRRLGSMLLEHFDNFVAPLAPEFDQARSVASRYLQAEDLEQARELAAARAGQFTGSGFENALRTEYRGLDRNAIKGKDFFSDDVNGAIQKVARGTPTSNFFRGMGRLAPTGPVSGMGSVVPAFAVGSMTSPTLGGLVGGSMAGSGILGRTVATRMGVNAADEAELIARNGGKLQQAPLMPKTLADFAAWLAASQAPKYANSPNR